MAWRKLTCCLAALGTALAFAVSGEVWADEHWPLFRGPHADGTAMGSTPPDTWSETENVAWSVKIPGRGWSSPIVWGKRVFVTSAVGRSDNPKMGRYGPAMVVKSEEPLKYTLFCLDAEMRECLA